MALRVRCCINGDNTGALDALWFFFVSSSSASDDVDVEQIVVSFSNDDPTSCDNVFGCWDCFCCCNWYSNFLRFESSLIAARFNPWLPVEKARIRLAELFLLLFPNVVEAEFVGVLLLLETTEFSLLLRLLFNVLVDVMGGTVLLVAIH